MSAILTQCQLNFSSSTSMVLDPLASSRIRRRACSLSSGVKKRESPGVLGMKKKQTIPNTTVMAPSTVKQTTC